MPARLARTVVAAALLASAAATTDATAAAPPALRRGTVVTGPAGGQVTVRLASALRVSDPFATVSASRGRFAGVAITNRSGAWAQQVGGLSGSCAFGGARCMGFDVAEVSGSGAGAETVLAAGTYTITLIGEPGTRVTAALAVRGARAGHLTLRTKQQRTVAVRDVESEVPAAGDVQPYARGTAPLPAAKQGRSLFGAVMRVDAEVLHAVKFDTCLHDGTTQVPLTCTNGEFSRSSDSYMLECTASTGGNCLPFATGGVVLTAAAAGVTAAATTVTTQVEVEAVKSRTKMVAYAIPLG